MTPRSTPLLVAGGLAAATVPVVRRMEHDYETIDDLRPSTVVAMYATYGAHTVALAWAATRRVWPVPIRTTPAVAVGAGLAAAGTVIAVAGMGSFDSAAQLSGTEPGTLHATGIYRVTRNPQYLGISIALAGVALTSRSAYTALLAAGVTATYGRWIPVEERHLTRTFGDSYRRYRASTHRWLGQPRTS